MGKREGQEMAFESLPSLRCVEACSLRRKNPSEFCNPKLLCGRSSLYSIFVVLGLPRRDFPPRIEQILKPHHGQTLFPQPSVETFDVRVLRRLAQLNVYPLDLPFY